MPSGEEQSSTPRRARPEELRSTRWGAGTPVHCLRFANPAEAVRCPDAGRLGAWRLGGIYAGHAVYAADKWVSGHPNPARNEDYGEILAGMGRPEWWKWQYWLHWLGNWLWCWEQEAKRSSRRGSRNSRRNNSEPGPPTRVYNRYY